MSRLTAVNAVFVLFTSGQSGEQGSRANGGVHAGGWGAWGAPGEPRAKPAVSEEALQAARSKWGSRTGAVPAPAPAAWAQPAECSSDDARHRSCDSADDAAPAGVGASRERERERGAPQGASKWARPATAPLLHATPPEDGAAGHAPQQAPLHPPPRQARRPELLRGWGAGARLTAGAQASTGAPCALPLSDDGHFRREPSSSSGGAEADAEPPARRRGREDWGAATEEVPPPPQQPMAGLPTGLPLPVEPPPSAHHAAATYKRLRKQGADEGGTQKAQPRAPPARPPPQPARGTVSSRRVGGPPQTAKANLHAFLERSRDAA